MILDIGINDLALEKEYILSKFNWKIVFLFKQGEFSVNEMNTITEKFEKLLSEENKKKLTDILNRRTQNSAITISNNKQRTSTILITQVTNLSQFVNSLVHEMLHVSRHINECENNEELFTTLGDISGSILREIFTL